MKKNVHKIPLEQTHAFSTLLSDYLAQHHTLESFRHFKCTQEGLQECLSRCSFPEERRQVLQQALRLQYTGLVLNEAVSAQLEKVGEKQTFFITTGQQIHVLGGPLYVLFKIATTIKLAEHCNRLMPDKHFVPLFWMASEDHDLEEIDHLNIFGKTYQAPLQGTGPAGRLSTEGLSAWLETLPDIPTVFKTAYKDFNTLSAATRYWLNELFGKHGLLVMDADDRLLKEQFIPVLQKELEEGIAWKAVQQQTEALEHKGYKAQIFPREINLFYLSEYGRNRIVLEQGLYKVLNTTVEFSPEQILEELTQHPDRFSPNVVLRPVYQEFILPNIAYIGGPAEVAYWMQLGKVFETLGLHMPVILPRNFAMIVGKQQQAKLQKLGLKAEDVFLPEEELKQHFLSVKEYVLPEWGDTSAQLNQLWQGVEEKTLKADGALKDWLAAEKHKIEKQLENIEKRVVKTYEQKLEQEMKQLATVKEKLLPGGGLQERSESFVSFMINDPTFTDDMVQLFDPLDFRFNIVSYED